MASALRSRLVGRFPGISWRDELLTRRSQQVATLRQRLEAAESRDRERLEAAEVRERELQATIATLQEAARRAKPPPSNSLPPSFRRHLLELRGRAPALRALDPEGHHPATQIPRKLRNYRLAASHGVAVPEVYAVWSRPDQIDFSGLPERFVLKCEIGSSGEGVFPLERLDDNRYQVIASDQIHTRESVVELLTGHTSVWGPYFVEEFLNQRAPSGQIPDDIKIYASYGQVLMVMLRQMTKHADRSTALFRYLDAQGGDLGDDIAPGRNISSAVPAPEPLADFVRVAEHLSRAVALPFIRVDVYDTDRGPVLGELTRSPGGPQRYRRDHDEAMGRLWDDAQWRLEMDVMDGRPLRNLHGSHPIPDLYPASHRSNWADPQGWKVFSADCSQWCFGRHSSALHRESDA